MTMHRRHTALPVRLALVSTALAVVGCHLLDISNPDVVPIDLLGGPSALGTVRAGAIGDFTLAYSGSGGGGAGGTIEGQIMADGPLAGEGVNSETLPEPHQGHARTTEPQNGPTAT